MALHNLFEFQQRFENQRFDFQIFVFEYKECSNLVQEVYMVSSDKWTLLYVIQ